MTTSERRAQGTILAHGTARRMRVLHTRTTLKFDAFNSSRRIFYLHKIMTIIKDIRDNFHVDNFYDVLRIPIQSSQQEIKKAYLQRSLELHPDKVTDLNKKEEHKRKFQILSAIYKILSNNQLKQDYDQQFQYSSQEYVESTLHEEVPLKKCFKQDGFYTYDCRCSGLFLLDAHHLTSASSDNQNVFIVNCDSCSSSIKITL